MSGYFLSGRHAAAQSARHRWHQPLPAVCMQGTVGRRGAHEIDVLLGAEALDELLVVRLVAVVRKDAELRLVLLQRPARTAAPPPSAPATLHTQGASTRLPSQSEVIPAGISAECATAEKRAEWTRCGHGQAEGEARLHTSCRPRARPSCARAVFMTRPRAVVWSRVSAGAGAAGAASSSPSAGCGGTSFSLHGLAWRVCWNVARVGTHGNIEASCKQKCGKARAAPVRHGPR